jgi:hypothetical protein
MNHLQNKNLNTKIPFFNKIDVFGIDYKFLINGEEKYKTNLGAWLTLLYIIINVGLFLGFGVDLYNRAKPKVSINSQIGTYEPIRLNNENFTYAYRVENRTAAIQLDTSIVYLELVYFYFTLTNGSWVTEVYEISQSNKRCHELPFYKEKELNYNISLENWYCLDFDNITTLGGGWDGNFVWGLQINTKQCVTELGAKNCSSREVISNAFQNNMTSGNFYYSDLSISVLPSMDDFETPLKTNLVNRYQILHPGITKRKIQTFKFTSINNDIGWFFEDIKTKSYIDTDTIETDLIFKDEWAQDIVFTQFLYLGRKYDTYNRSYTKIQEVFAAIGGFAKFFFIFVNIIFNFSSDTYRDLLIASNSQFKLKDEEDSQKSNLVNMKIPNEIKNDEFSTRLKVLKVKYEKSKVHLPENISYSQYLCRKCKGTKKFSDNANKIITNLEYVKNFYRNQIEIFSYHELHNQFNQLKKIFLDKYERIALSNLNPSIRIPSKNEKKILIQTSKNLSISDNENFMNLNLNASMKKLNIKSSFNVKQ